MTPHSAAAIGAAFAEAWLDLWLACWGWQRPAKRHQAAPAGPDEIPRYG